MTGDRSGSQPFRQGFGAAALAAAALTALLAGAGCGAAAGSGPSEPSGEDAPPLAPAAVPARPAAEAAPPPVPETLVEAPEGVLRADFEEEILLTGELRAVRATSIVSPETSIFQMRIQYLPDEGTEVREGDPLVDFDNSALADRVLDLETRILDAETQIAAKRSEIESALMDLEIERTRKQYEADRARVRVDVDPAVLSRKDFAEREYEDRKAALELEEVLERIEKTRRRGMAELDVLIIEKEKLERDLISTRKDLEVLSVKAPIDGLVVYEYREGAHQKWKEGDSVWPGQPILSLPDLSEMEVQFQVSEVDAHRLSEGMPVSITVDSFPDRELTGEIVSIPSMAVARSDNSGVRIFRVRSTLSETWRERMKPGMSVLGRVKVGGRAGALLVPREAVSFDGATYRVLAAPARGGRPAWLAIRPIARGPRHYVLEDPPEAVREGRLFLPGSPAGGASPDGSWAPVRREDFRSTIEATGSLEAAVSTYIGPPSVPDIWSYNLTFMAPEGNVVKEGDVVARFDGTAIEERLREVQAEHETARKEREKEEKSLEVELRRIDLELVEQRSELERSELDAAVPEGLVSSIEARELELRERLARDQVAFLEKKIQARREQVAAQLKLLDVKKRRAEQRIRYYEASLEKFAVRAPSDGVIVYVRKRDGSRWEIGESVWMLAKVLQVADLSSLRVSAQLLEVDAGRVREDLPASVTVDAIPGKLWKSRVEKVGRLVRPRSQQDPGKVFDVYLPLDEIDRKSMRPGMSLRVEIEEAVMPSALTVPLAAVRDRGGEAVVVVEGSSGPQERVVRLGPRNGERIVVLEGLSEGERVSLSGVAGGTT